MDYIPWFAGFPRFSRPLPRPLAIFSLYFLNFSQNQMPTCDIFRSSSWNCDVRLRVWTWFFEISSCFEGNGSLRNEIKVSFRALTEKNTAKIVCLLSLFKAQFESEFFEPFYLSLAFVQLVSDSIRFFTESNNDIRQCLFNFEPKIETWNNN